MRVRCLILSARTADVNKAATALAEVSSDFTERGRMSRTLMELFGETHRPTRAQTHAIMAKKRRMHRKITLRVCVQLRLHIGKLNLYSFLEINVRPLNQPETV